MNTVRTARIASLSALALGLALVVAPKAHASSWDVGIGIGVARPAPVPCGHYETRIERVLIEPEHIERRVVDPVYETRYIRGNPTTFMVRAGYTADVVIPARYEDRYVKVWVPSCPPPAPVITSGFLGLDFGHGRRW
ncbi:MAG TPA: hypothetical protein VKX17_21445 [Planctomycetota bacterium]|nr:hypothetical protein [Planctomycetota bacterium]